jgi:citrate lyase alpha subunit
MKFEPVLSFLFGKQSIEKQANHLRAKKEQYINNAAMHFWINKDAIGMLETLIIDTQVIIKMIEKELKH